MIGQLSFGDGEEPDEEPRVRLHQNPAYSPFSTLRDARDRLEKDILNGGEVCPCCGRPARVAKRSIHTAQAIGLIKIARHGGMDDYVDTAAITRHTAYSDVAKNAWWGLITELEERRVDGGRAGWWKLTPRGRLFVMRVGMVQKYVHTFNDEVQWRSGPQVTIEDCLHNRFDWRELMYG